MTMQGSTYESRVESERRYFSEHKSADQLPEIFHYWSNKYLRPKLERYGYSHPEQMFLQHLDLAYRASRSPKRRFLSIGSGACGTEISLSKALVKRGHVDFSFECLELNGALLAEAQETARREQVSAQFVAIQGDANTWQPKEEYDGILANSSLHHIQNLEGVFDGIRRSLKPTGTFVTSDTIGRNGHLRWPEALTLVEEFWEQLEPRHKYNHQLRRDEPRFDDWDCSGEGFEGIRAQDILPLLIAHFDFDFFLGFANIVDPFIDRSFGPNFSVNKPADLAFIDRVQERDEVEILRGAIKPTHILAAMCAGRAGKNLHADGLSPEFCVRNPGKAPTPLPNMQRAKAPLPTMPVRFGADVTLSIIPATPRSFDYLVARLDLGQSSVRQEIEPIVTRDNDRVRIDLRVRNSELLEPLKQIEAGLGRFPPGLLSVHVQCDQRPLVSPKTVMVEDRATPDSEPHPSLDYSDLWSDPDATGSGLSIHQHPSGKIMAVWCVYDENEHPCWYSLRPGRWVAPTRFEGPIYSLRGTHFRDAHAPSELNATIVGVGTLVFADHRNGRFHYEIDGISGERSIVRMEF